MDRINIFHLRASNFYGGPERQLHHHARLASGSQFNIINGSFSENGKIPEFLQVFERDNLKTTLFKVTSAYDTRSIKLVRNYIIENKIDILCTHDYRTLLVGLRAVKKTNSKLLAFSRGWTQDTLRVRFYHLLDKIFIRFADHIVAVSAAQKQKLKKCHIRDSHISVVLNSVDANDFAGIKKIDLRSKFNFPKESIVCISGGRFSSEKGQETFVKAAKMVLEKNDLFRFILFGSGPDLDNVRNKIKTLDLGEKIICPGFEKNLIGCIKDADIMVNPSLTEGLPNILLEAMAVGTAIVATDVGGVPEIITNGVDGILVPAENPFLLSEKILYLGSKPVTAIEFGKNSLKKVQSERSFSYQYEQLTNIYIAMSESKL